MPSQPSDYAYNTLFEVDFREFVPVYNGLKGVWIGDGTTFNADNSSGGTAGYLYAKYYDGMTQGLGYVSDYEAAKALVPSLTYAQWVEMLQTVPSNAASAADSKQKAQQWATGNTSGTYTTGNSAKEQADRAAVWAVGTSSGNGSSSNNAKSWAEQSSSYATTASGHATTATQQANLATQKANAASTSATNASGSATAAANSATAAAGSATAAANSAQTAAEKANSVKGATSTTTYQNSTSGTTVPTGTWTSTPNPEKGKYVWTKTVLTWTDTSSSTYYTVNYIGNDGSNVQTITHAEIDALQD